MTKNKQQKNWFRRHWIITLILALVLMRIGIDLIYMGTDSNIERINTEIKDYTNEDIYTLITLFVSTNSPYTDLQKEEEFKQYRDKWIRSSGIVKEIDQGLTGGIVVRLYNPENYLLSGATLYFDSSEKDKLLQVTKDSEIDFEGRVEDYSSFIGIIIKDVKLVE